MEKTQINLWYKNRNCIKTTENKDGNEKHGSVWIAKLLRYRNGTFKIEPFRKSAANK